MGRIVIFKDVIFWYWIMTVNVWKIWRTHQTNVFRMTNVLCQKTIHTIRVFHKQKLPMDFNVTEYRNVVYSIWDSTLFFQLNPLQIKNNNNFKKAPFVKRFAIVSKIQIQQSLLHECSFSLMTMIHEIKWSIHLLLLCSSLNSFLWTMSWHGEMLAFSKADLHF